MSTALPSAQSHKSADFAPSQPPPPQAPLNKEDFARHWGFASFLELFEASKPVGDAGGKQRWLLTALRGGKWLLWNEAEMASARLFESREEALPNVPQEGRSPENSEAAKMQA
jgi:hypothetical protein